MCIRDRIARDREVVSPSYGRDYPFVMSHGRGAEVWDVDGNRFVDFAAGIAVCSTGHCHPAVVSAIQEAATRFLHISSDYWHEGQVRLAEVIRKLDPVSGPAVSFFANSGAEAVEAALKLARFATGRSRYIGFLGAFHRGSVGPNPQVSGATRHARSRDSRRRAHRDDRAHVPASQYWAAPSSPRPASGWRVSAR